VNTAPLDFGALEARFDAIAELSGDVTARDAEVLAAELLVDAEHILETWVLAHEGVPTDARKEGFRLLALHTQGARGEPSFNACRETCREIVFQHNVVAASVTDEERARALRLMIMVVRHLSLFISGKLEVAGLGEFCCASKPLRRSGEGLPAAAA